MEINYIELAQKFIDEHNSHEEWSPLDRNEVLVITMFAKWLDSNMERKREK